MADGHADMDSPEDPVNARRASPSLRRFHE